MASPDLTTEGGKAGVIVVAGMTLLKMIERWLLRLDRRHHDQLEELDQTVKTGTRIRDEQRIVMDRQAVEIKDLKAQLAACEAELRAWRRGDRSPRLPSKPREGC